MTQQDLDAAVALATGEDIAQIRRRGFSISDPLDVLFDPEPSTFPPQVIDWDEVDRSLNVSLFAQR